MSVFERCLEKCRARKGVVVYSDGEDRRVVSAAAKLIREGLVEPILIGDPEKVRTALQEEGAVGILTGGLTAAAAGITTSLVCGVICSLVGKSHDQN